MGLNRRAEQTVGKRTRFRFVLRAADMWTLIALLLAFVHIAFALVYLYLTRYHGYWDKRGLVTAKPLTLLGSYPGLFGGPSNFIGDLGKIYK